MDGFVWMDAQPTHVFLVTDLAEGGELFQALISVRPTCAACVMLGGGRGS